MIVVDEIVIAELPEEHRRLDDIDDFVQNQIFLQRAIAARAIGKDLHTQFALEEGMVSPLIGDG